MSPRLSAAAELPVKVERSDYTPEAHTTGIVHIGVGAFHKAHQAAYTDTALGIAGGDWRILGVSLRSPEAADALNPQDGRYILIARDQAGDSARVIASIAYVLVAPREPEKIIAAIADPATRIVTLTITEKAYGLDRTTGGLDSEHPAMAHDLAHPDAPKGAVGFLVAGLARRMAGQGGPLTILCCDNLSENGAVLSRLVSEFTARGGPALSRWITANVRFPSSMVDRITPASTEHTYADAKAFSGYSDHAAIETEPFSQWIIEDDFAAGRPAWDKAGVLFVHDIAPYERMKLRLLNGAHSLIAYTGFLAGYETVAEAIADPAINALVQIQMRAAAKTLQPVPGIDLETYQSQLIARFSNRAIRHLTYQIAMDGTEKIPQRILAPLSEIVASHGDPTPFTFAIAAWMRYCVGTTDAGQPYALRDPREHSIARQISAAGRDASRIHDALFKLPGLFPASLKHHAVLRSLLVTRLRYMLDNGMEKALSRANSGQGFSE